MTKQPEPLHGRRIVVVGLLGGLVGLAVSFFLESVVANTPVAVTSYAQFWFRVLLGVFGTLGAMALETVRQLQESNPDPEYHRQQQLRRGRGNRGP